MTERPDEEEARARAWIERWTPSGAGERGGFQSFLIELCEVLGVPPPDPPVPEVAENRYAFERPVTFRNPDGTTSPGAADLYRAGCFVMEAKQGSDPAAADPETPVFGEKVRRRRGTAVRGTPAWDDAMLRARGQAEQYAKALHDSGEPWPPFLVVVDVGHVFELYADFSRSGKTYLPFPDARSYRTGLKDAASAEFRALLRALWTDPLSLDPARRAARVTREVADRLAALAKSLEASERARTGATTREERAGIARAVAEFLMRALFTMFAEDVGLLPADGLTRLLEECRGRLQVLPARLKHLWMEMDKGGFSATLGADILRFNGGLFESSAALPLTEDQLGLLIDAARSDWSHVEPAIFGTLLERALDEEERHKLGAHYTPRAYVERLVLPTVIEPLRAEWTDVQAAAVALAKQGKLSDAQQLARDFHARLCRTTVLDPACGSGNFLYVTMEHMKRLEGEVLRSLEDLGMNEPFSVTGEREAVSVTVDPHQFLGIELNPRAATIAEMVLWIGYLQWHFRTRGKASPPEPVLRKFRNIECRDAVLAWDGEPEPARDEDGKVLTRWDGKTMKRHPATGEEVPDETARVPLWRYKNPRKARWPKADYVVGNPPFVGNWRMRETLGDGYVETLRAVHDDVPESADYVMYWWNHAAGLARGGEIARFGLITTNSLRQTYARRVTAAHLEAKEPLSLLFAIPDHPWVDSADGAAVRIAMTVGAAGEREGALLTVVREEEGEEQAQVEFARRVGRILPDLTVGPNVAGAAPLQASEALAGRGVQLMGSGFMVTSEEAAALGLGRVPGLEAHIREYRNGRDLTNPPRGVMVIDLFGLSESQVRERFPQVYQWVLERVKPEREQNQRKTYREKWWVFGEPRSDLRPVLRGLSRYIATVETSKHRFFTFLDAAILPDNRLVCIGCDDAYVLGVLSSLVHLLWDRAAGGLLEDRPVYNKSKCFDPFPFPDPGEADKARIRELGEALDRHRKERQALHPDLTITDMYNVLAKLRAGEALSEKERGVHEAGLVSVLRRVHDDLDAAVLAAYGWPAGLSDEEILARLVALNRERAEEEARGVVRWLRPDFQNPTGRGAAQKGLDLPGVAEPAAEKAAKKRPWPKALPEQVRALGEALAALPAPASAEALAKSFRSAPRARVTELLEALVSLGRARKVDGAFVA